jgi:glycerol-3-phosphate dehydrogenase
LLRVYGKAAAGVAELAARPELAGTLGDSDVLTAELVHALTNEWAVTLEDFLQRRCMAGLDADFGLRVVPAAAAALTRLGVWDSVRAERELAAYRELAARRGALTPSAR